MKLELAGRPTAGIKAGRPWLHVRRRALAVGCGRKVPCSRLAELTASGAAVGMESESDALAFSSISSRGVAAGTLAASGVKV